MPVGMMTVDAVTTDEDELLAEFASDPANLIPDMTLITEAIITVDLEDLMVKGGVRSHVFDSITSTLAFPDIAVFNTDDTEETDKIGINPLFDVSDDEENFGFYELTGDKSKLVNNDTDTHYTQLDITDNFSVENYQYLIFEKLITYVQTSTSSLIVSFGKTSGANISTSAETYNCTIFSSVIYPISTNLWYNLACHTNSTFSYVINIEAKNIKCDGYEVFKFDNGKFVSDSRYNVAYTDADESEVSLSTETISLGDRTLIELAGSTNSDMTIQATTLSDLNTTKMLSAVSNIDTQQDMHVVVRGWKTADELETSLYAMWRQQLGLKEGDRITDYEITKGYWQNTINKGTAKLMQRELKSQLDSQTDYNALMNNVRKKYLPICAVANNKEMFDSITKSYSTQGFWDTIKDGITNVANTVTSVVSKVLDTPANTIGALGDSVANIVTPIAQTVTTAATDIIPSVTNMITDNVGNLVEGVQGVAGSAVDLGGSVMDTLKIPLIIVASVLTLGIIGVIIWKVRAVKIPENIVGG